MTQRSPKELLNVNRQRGESVTASQASQPADRRDSGHPDVGTHRLRTVTSRMTQWYSVLSSCIWKAVYQVGTGSLAAVGRLERIMSWYVMCPHFLVYFAVVILRLLLRILVVILRLEIKVCFIVYVIVVNTFSETCTPVRQINSDEEKNKCDVSQPGRLQFQDIQFKTHRFKVQIQCCVKNGSEDQRVASRDPPPPRRSRIRGTPGLLCPGLLRSKDNSVTTRARCISKNIPVCFIWCYNN